jgi:hypothetical protein
MDRERESGSKVGQTVKERECVCLSAREREKYILNEKEKEKER